MNENNKFDNTDIELLKQKLKLKDYATKEICNKIFDFSRLLRQQVDLNKENIEKDREGYLLLYDECIKIIHSNNKIYDNKFSSIREELDSRIETLSKDLVKLCRNYDSINEEISKIKKNTYALYFINCILVVLVMILLIIK